jgi:adenylate kinase
LISNLDEEAHLIADGYPRTVGQSTNLEKTMEFFKRKDIKIIYIELSEAEATKRNLLRGRADDTEEGLRRRFNEYKNNVIPAMDYFKNKEGYEIYTINGEQSVEDVHKEIINKLGMN